MTTDIQTTIANLEARLQPLEQRIDTIKQTIELLRQLDAETPIAPPRQTRGLGGAAKTENIPKNIPPRDVPKPVKAKPPHRPGPRPRRWAKKRSQYKGVTIIARRQGPAKYQATYWDRKLGKAVHLGTFDDEIQCAIMVARRLGKTEEVKRLSGLLEHAENNPDRPAGPGKAGIPTGHKPPSPAQAPSKARSSHKGASATTYSQYKGVTKGKTRTDGTITFKAGAWSPTDKRNHRLGTYEIEELAAAAVEEFLGHADEAKRLRAMAEQKKADAIEQAENNPDRGQETEPGPAGVEHVSVAWECGACGHIHLVAARPRKCEKCRHESLRKIC